MQKPRLFHAAAAILGLCLWGCSETHGPLTVPLPEEGGPVAQYLDDPCGDPLVLTLMSGPRLELGGVTVANDEDLLQVTLDVSESPWLLAESYVVIRGPGGRLVRPTVGHLRQMGAAFHQEHDPPTNLWNFDVDLDEYGFGPGDVLRMSVRAMVELWGEGDEPLKRRRAWAMDFNQPHPAQGMFFDYTVQTCEEPEPCTLTVLYPNGGDFLCSGWEIDIEWASDFCGAEVRIDLLLHGHVCDTVVEATDNDGSYTWMVAPCNWETEYSLRITDLESGASDECEAPFTIGECL